MSKNAILKILERLDTERLYREVDRLGLVTKALLPEHNEIRKYALARRNLQTTFKIIEYLIPGSIIAVSLQLSC